MNKKIIIPIAVVGAVVVGGGITAIVNKDKIAEAFSKKDSGIVVAVSEEPNTLNPVLKQNMTAMNINEMLYDGLANYEIENGFKKLKYAIASNIEQDGKKQSLYHIDLRRDVKFHDGTPCTADDVVFSYNAYLNDANGATEKEYLSNLIKSVTKGDDEYSVDINFQKPMPDYRVEPILTNVKIIPATYKGMQLNENLADDANAKKFGLEPIGTGPYKFASWEAGNQVTFEKNYEYFAKPELDKKPDPEDKKAKALTVVVKVMADPVTRLQEMSKNRVNLILETNPADRQTVKDFNDNAKKNDTQIEIVSYMPYAFYQLAINTNVITKVDGRKAIAKAINKPQLVPGITNANDGSVIINDGPYPANTFEDTIAEYYDNVEIPNLNEYELTVAQKLAATSKLNSQNYILVYPDTLGAFGENLANAISVQLKQLGISVTARKLGASVYDEEVKQNKTFQLALQYCDGYDDHYTTLTSMYATTGKENVTGVRDKKLDQYLSEAEIADTTEKWHDAVLKVNRKVAELVPTVALCTVQKEVYAKNLEGVKILTDNVFLSVEDWSKISK